MTGIKSALALSLVILLLLLLSRSPEASAQRSAEPVGPPARQPSGEDVSPAFQTRKNGIHMKFGSGQAAGVGQAGNRGCVDGSGGGGGGYGGQVLPGGGAKPYGGTHKSSAIGSRPLSLASAGCSALVLVFSTVCFDS